MVTLPASSNVDDVRVFLRNINVDTICLRNTKEMMTRYNMTAPLLNKQVGDILDNMSIIAFRHIFETLVI